MKDTRDGVYMITMIIKRDGRKVPFNVEKIAKAIYKAAVAVGGKDYEEAEELATKVCKYVEKTQNEECPTVEKIQDAVEHVLIEEGHAATAKAYILYRSERTKQREMNSDIMKTYEQLTFQDAKDSDVKRENANINADTAMGTMLKYGSEGAKKFYQMFVLKKDHAQAHINGDIHIHDLDFLTLTTTCCQIDLIKLFHDGFSTGEGHLREPQSIGSYAALAAIAIQSNQNDQHGGQSIPNFEYAMAQGIRKSYQKLYAKNLQKAIELLTDVENADEVKNMVIAKINEEEDLVPALESALNMLKDVKYSKEVANDIILKIKSENKIIPYLKRTIELLSSLESSEEIAKEIMENAQKKGVKFLLPVDTKLGKEFAPDTESKTVSCKEIPDNWQGFDIGPETIKQYVEEVKSAKTVIWNGPLGLSEFEQFAIGTDTMAQTLADLNDCTTIIGGGDSAAAVERAGLADKMTHISTGGGASLEFLEGKKLPGIECLQDK